MLRDLSALKYECAGPASTVRLTRPICLTLLNAAFAPAVLPGTTTSRVTPMASNVQVSMQIQSVRMLALLPED